MSLKTPTGYSRISPRELKDLLDKAQKESAQARAENPFSKAPTVGQILSHYLNSKGIYTDCFAPARDNISYADAVDVVQHYTNKKFESDVLNGRYHLSKEQADEVMRSGSDSMKAIVIGMNGKFGHNVTNPYSCNYVA